MLIISLLRFNHQYQKALAESFPEHEIRHYRNFSEIPASERYSCEVLWSYAKEVDEYLEAFPALRWIGAIWARNRASSA